MGGLNSKLYAVCDQQARTVLMLLTEGQRSDHVGGALLLPHMPHAEVLLADRGYDSNSFRAGLAKRGITACIPPMPGRRNQLAYDKVL